MAIADSTLTAIQNKVRRLTRSPSVNQLTNAELNQYINTFVLYDFPEHLRLFTLHVPAQMTLSPYQDTYDLASITLPSDPTVTLTNEFITINPPMYVGGRQALFTQSREQFYNLFPNIQSIVAVGAGDGATTNFQFTIAGGYLLQDNFSVTSITTANVGLICGDDGSGVLGGDGVGTIDYVTGAVNVTFNTAPGVGQPVNAHYVQYQASQPTAILFFGQVITVRPVPDDSYLLNFEVYLPPLELLASNQSPVLNQWWQYIAYGAAKKVFEDRMDLESVQQIMPEYKQQERLVLRTTIVQNTNERVATIYTEQTNFGNGFNNFYNSF